MPYTLILEEEPRKVFLELRQNSNGANSKKRQFVAIYAIYKVFCDYSKSFFFASNSIGQGIITDFILIFFPYLLVFFLNGKNKETLKILIRKNDPDFE